MSIHFVYFINTKQMIRYNFYLIPQGIAKNLALASLQSPSFFHEPAINLQFFESYKSW